MSESDLARLEVAKRAFQAAAPRAAEVQTGVRRARLFLGRPKPRRNWFSKGLVFVVLALGSLAYAKPRALGDLAQDLLPRLGPSSSRGGVKPAAAPAKPVRTTTLPAPATTPAPARPQAAPTQTQAEAAKVELDVPLREAAASTKPSRQAVTARAKPPLATIEADSDRSEQVVSAWGRVGQALAQGDDMAALSALQDLSESDDQRTRDIADLGRAQLFLAHGEADRACALARSLRHRGAGARVERQAQVLLESCKR